MKTAGIALCVIVLVLMGCAGVPKVRYSVDKTLLLPDSTTVEKTINGVSIRLSKFDVSKELMDPKYKRNFNIMYTPYFAPIYENFVRIINPYANLTPLQVTVTNTTDQIIKIGEARVMYIDPITDAPTEPYMALDPYAIYQNPAILPAFQITVNSFNEQKPQNSDFLNQVGNEVRGVVQQIKFLNQKDREIMPGMKFTGLILLPIEQYRISKGRLSFIDVVTKSATAGYPEEKVRFDFTLMNVTKFFKQDKAVSKDWVEIPAEQYNLETTLK